MSLEKLAEALGLAKDCPQNEIFSRLLAERKEGIAAKEELAKLKGELAGFDLKLDQGKLVKVEGSVEALDLSAKEGDDAEKVALKKQLADARRVSSIAALSQVKVEADRLVKEGRVPPTVKEALARLLSAPEKSQVLALSADGKDVVAHFANVREDALAVLNALPKLSLPTKLSTLKSEPLVGEAGGQKKTAEELSRMAKEDAAKHNSRSSKTAREAARKK